MKSAIALTLLHNVRSFLAVEFSESEASRAIGSLSFAMFGKGSRKSKGKMPNCTPGKSWSCGYACLPMSKKNCGSPLPGQAKTYADYMAKQVQAQSSSKGQSSGKVTMSDEGIPSRIPASLSEMQDYVRKWQKDRGYDKKPPDLFFDMHDTNHGLAYLVANRSPESIQKEFGYPGRKYAGQPDTAEEAYVAIAENAFLKGATRDIAIDRVYSSFYARGGVNASALSPDEQSYYRDPARRADLEKMYDEIIAAPQEVKDLLAKNNSRLKRVVSNGFGGKFIDEYAIKTIKRKYKDAFTDFAEDSNEILLIRDLRKFGLDDDAIARQLTRIQYSSDNIAGKRQYFDEILQVKLELVQNTPHE